MDAPEAKKLPHNVPGKYYTTEECDGCAYCASVAPENFDFEKESNTYFVARQPADKEEEEILQEAKEDCPVDAIRTGVDGDSKEEPPNENK
jgi:ferredoxin